VSSWAVGAVVRVSLSIPGRPRGLHDFTAGPRVLSQLGIMKASLVSFLAALGVLLLQFAIEGLVNLFTCEGRLLPISKRLPSGAAPKLVD
jgi:hypothetical protein